MSTAVNWLGVEWCVGKEVVRGEEASQNRAILACNTETRLVETCKMYIYVNTINKI